MELRMTNGYSPSGWLYRPWNRLWEDLENGASHSYAPRADVIEDNDGYHFAFEMPGLESASVDVRIEDQSLIVEAERTRPERPENVTVHVAERTYGKLRRAFALPEDAVNDNIRASYKDGVLEVTVPKRPEAKPVKIKVELN